MPNETEKIHRKLQAELQVFCNLAKPQSEEEIKKVFDVILATVERVVELYDDEVTTIYQMAEDLFDEGDDRIQAMTFEFMKKLINVFERNVDHVAARSLTVSKFLAFYFSVVCRRSRQTKLCERAIDHAVRYCDYPQLYRKLAMQAFEPVWFLHYSLERFDKKTVKNLLSLTAAKLSCDPYTEGLIPGTLSFLSKVCDIHDTCGFCIRVCKVLQFLLQAPSFQVLVVLEGSGVLRWVLRHVSAFRAKRKCWEAIARFLTAAFLYADGETRQMLADLDIFMRVHEMFSDRRKSVIDELLELVRVACEARSGRWVNHLLDFAVFLDVVSLVEHPQMEYTHRPKACRALNTFFANARIEQIVRGLNEGLTAWIVRLLKSRNESVSMDAMIWLFVAIDAISNRGLYTDLEDFVNLIRRLGGEQHLTRLCFHEKGFIRFAAAKLRERLEDTPSDMSCRALYARKSEKAAVIDSHPDPTLGLGAFLL